MKIVCEYHAPEEAVEAMKNVNSLEEYEVAGDSYSLEEAFAAFVIAKGLEKKFGEWLMEKYIDYSHFVDVVSEYTEEE